MNNHASRTDRIAAALADKIVRWRWLVILVTLVLAGLVASGAPKLTLSTSYQSFFSPDYPELVAFEEFQKTYSKTDNILFVIQPTEKTVFTPQTAEAIERLTDVCRTFWPVLPEAPEPRIVKLREQFEDLWPFDEFDTPWEWYWGLQEMG